MAKFLLVSIFVAILSGLFGLFYVNQKDVYKFMVHRNFSKFKYGTLCLYQEETKSIQKFGVAKDVQCDASIVFENIENEDKFYEVLTINGGATGIGETYMNGLWSIESDVFGISDQDLADVSYHFIFNVVKGNGSPIVDQLFAFKNMYNEFIRKYGITKSKEEDEQNIQYHYDLDNDFYKLFLGPKLSGYSCGFFNDATDSVFEAQDNKWNLIYKKMNISSSDNKKIIDIGSGWGYFPSFMNNKSKNLETFGITIAKQQYKFSVDSYSNANYELLDYRDLDKKYNEFFDGAVSIGMVEHVGLSKLDEFFSNIFNSLKSDSYFLLHYVSRTDIFPNWRKTSRANACGMSNFISEYIFPGGCILHKDWVHQIAEENGFKLVHSETFGHHYMRTLEHWRRNFVNNWPQYGGKHKNNEVIYKMYEFYFAWCEAAFRSQRINLQQMLLYKPPTNKKYTNKLTYRHAVINPNSRQ